MQRIAIIDIGSNSARLVISHIYKNGAYNMVYNQKEALRLSQKVDEKNMLTEVAFSSTIETMKSFAYMCKIYQADKTIAVATAAIRNAANGAELVARVAEETGIQLHIISGNTEAYISYLGVINTINVKDGIIEEALVETIGCSGMTHSAAMASEILPGKTILEALNTDLVCDAINVAMREIFLQIVYGRSQTAFSEGGLPVGASLDDLGKGLRSQVGTMFGTKAKGARYLELAQGYVTRMALNDKNEIIAFEFLNLGKFTDAVKAGKTPEEAIAGAMGHYGQWENAAKYIDPRTDEETHSVASVFPVHE